MDFVIAVTGWTGTTILLAAYALLTVRKLRASGWRYQAMNLAGGLALMVNTAYYSAWPSAFLNLAWFGIGLAGLLRTQQKRLSDAPPPLPLQKE